MIFKEKNEIVLNAPKRLKGIDIQTHPYPGFPTDMQSVFLSMFCTARGTSVIIENIFENRFKCVPELTKMGAKVSISGSTAVIKGVRRLVGKNVVATDLRGGAALVGAALKARGITTIDNCEFVERGYENLEYKLKKLDVDIVKQRSLNIETEEKKVNDLKQLGYNIYDRNISSDIYKIENTTEFYLTENELYLIYAYGNNSQTSERDLVIL